MFGAEEGCVTMACEIFLAGRGDFPPQRQANQLR